MHDTADDPSSIVVVHELINNMSFSC